MLPAEQISSLLGCPVYVQISPDWQEIGKM